MRSKEEKEKILECWKNKVSQNKASQLLNIPRSTIKDYYKRLNSGIIINDEQKIVLKDLGENLTEADLFRAHQYCYVLGFYLGDGHISKIKRTYRIRIFQDKKFKNLIEEQSKALQDIFPENKVSLIKHAENCVVIQTYSNYIIELFPQHGPGKKHEREITLQEWQRKLIEQNPKPFIKGLIISDGCRFKQTNCNSFYYQFTNMSLDIKNLFVWACGLIGINLIKQNTNSKNIMVRNQDYVKILDEFIGEKS